MARNYRFAIVGAGTIGRTHAEQLMHTQGAELVAVCDIVPERARAIADKYRCDEYTDLTEMLSRSDVDIVNVCTPSGLHCEHTVAVANAGKHVITEKPIAISLEQADLMIETCRAKGVKLCVISQRRFVQTNLALKRDIDHGTFGRILLGTASINWYRSQEYYDSSGWRGTRALDGGGALMNQGIHTIDLLQYFMGPVTNVSARCQTAGHNIQVEDVAVVTLQFQSGAIGTIVGTTCAFPGLSTRIELLGMEGSIVMEDDREIVRKLRSDLQPVVDDALKGRSSPGNVQQKESSEANMPSNPSQVLSRGHIPQFEDMMMAIEEGREPKINGEEARKPLEIILSIYESAAQSGMPVSLEVR